MPILCLCLARWTSSISCLKLFTHWQLKTIFIIWARQSIFYKFFICAKLKRMIVATIAITSWIWGSLLTTRKKSTPCQHQGPCRRRNQSPTSQEGLREQVKFLARLSVPSITKWAIWRSGHLRLPTFLAKRTRITRRGYPKKVGEEKLRSQFMKPMKKINKYKNLVNAQKSASEKKIIF